MGGWDNTTTERWRMGGRDDRKMEDGAGRDNRKDERLKAGDDTKDMRVSLPLFLPLQRCNIC
jgi:hypothetical protein